MSKYEQALNSAFGVPIVAQSPDVITYQQPESQTTSDKHDDDEFSEISDNINELLKKSEDAIESLTDIAKAEESPRAFEVLNTMILTMTDLNMRLIEIEERKAKLKKLRNDTNVSSEETKAGGVVNNNVVFVGTTQELQQMIRQRLNGNN